MTITSKMQMMRGCTLALIAVSGATAWAQTDKPKLAPAYEGRWDNLEEPINGWMRIVIDKIGPDGAVQGKYTRNSRICFAEGVAMKGKLEGDTLSLSPDFGSDFKCKDTNWKFQLQADGRLTGPGESYFRLRADLNPVAK